MSFRLNTDTLLTRIKNSSLFRDSFWAVFGNGLGNFLLLVAGIVIARLLGKDYYGAYGLAKATMFQVATFSTFGLGITATKFISQYREEDSRYLRSISYSAIRISLLFSAVVSIVVFVFAGELSHFTSHDELKPIFRYISILVVIRALGTVGAGLLAGLHQFKRLGMNNIISGIVMLVISFPLSMYVGLLGALISLSISQLFLSILNLYTALKVLASLPNQQMERSFDRELIIFSFPVALQELSYTIFVWASNLLMAKYAIGELGIYSACSQWNAVVLMIPNLLYNVVLSYLSGSRTKEEQHLLLRKLVLINFICAFIPFFIVSLFSSIISSFYGADFAGMKIVLNILLLSTVFYSCTNVFYSFLISKGRNWTLCILKFSRDALMVVSLFLILYYNGGINAAKNYAILNTVVAALYLLVLSSICRYLEKNEHLGRL